MYQNSISTNDGVTTYGEWETESDFRNSLPPTRTWTDQNPIALGESWVETAGLTGSRLVTLFDLLLQTKEAGTLASKPKLVALYTWLQNVKAVAIAGGTEFPASPYTFEDVVTE